MMAAYEQLERTVDAESRLVTERAVLVFSKPMI
jgi:hypothetical protein